MVPPAIVRPAAFAVALVLLLALSGSAVAAEPCKRAVLADWAQDGRIDDVYALPCYGDAIAALPLDVRDYTNAAEVIQRALTAVLRDGAQSEDDRGARGAGAEPATENSSPSPAMLALVAAAGVVVATAASYAVLRRQRARARPEGASDGIHG